jgi:hypothetical protein
MPKVKTQPRCAWELCNKKLIDLAFICKADGRLFCDETCCERASGGNSESEVLMAMKTRCDHCDRMFGLKRYPDVCTQPREPQFCSKLCRDTYQDKWDRGSARSAGSISTAPTT